MPRRERRDKRKRLELTPALDVALAIGPYPETPRAPLDPSDDALRGLWVEHGERLLARARPWANWAYSEDVPAHLRAERPHLREVLDDDDEEAAATPAERAAEAELEERPCAWLERQRQRKDAA